MPKLIKKLLTKAVNKLTNRNTLYYPGCVTRFVLPEVKKKYESVLSRLGIEYIALKDKELCCGSPVLHAGYTDEFKKIKEKNLEIFAQYGIGKIITNCPGCYHIFKTEYGIKSEHISQTIAKKLKKLSLKQKKGEISYHDPCHLGRFMNVYEEPRQIIKAAGLEIKEMHSTKEESVCCGGGGGLKSNFPKIANIAAKERLNQCPAAKLITTCPMCYLHLKENSKNIEVAELSEVLDYE